MENKNLFSIPFRYKILLFYVGIAISLYAFGFAMGAGAMLTPIAHLCLAMGSISVSFVGLVFCQKTMLISPESPTLDSSSIKAVLAGIGYLVGFFLFLTGLFSITISMPLTGLPINYSRLSETYFTLFVLLVGCFLYVLFCYIYIWTKFVVRDDEIVVLDKKVLYSGEKYRLWFSNAHAECFQGQCEQASRSFTYANGKITAIVSAKIVVDWKKAKLNNVRALDLDALKKGITKWFWPHFEANIAQMTADQLFAGQMVPAGPVIAGFPVYWDGRFRLETGK